MKEREREKFQSASMREILKFAYFLSVHFIDNPRTGSVVSTVMTSQSHPADVISRQHQVRSGRYTPMTAPAPVAAAVSGQGAMFHEKPQDPLVTAQTILLQPEMQFLQINIKKTLEKVSIKSKRCH